MICWSCSHGARVSHFWPLHKGPVAVLPYFRAGIFPRPWLASFFLTFLLRSSQASQKPSTWLNAKNWFGEPGAKLIGWPLATILIRNFYTDSLRKGRRTSSGRKRSLKEVSCLENSDFQSRRWMKVGGKLTDTIPFHTIEVLTNPIIEYEKVIDTDFPLHPHTHRQQHSFNTRPPNQERYSAYMFLKNETERYFHEPIVQ
jgi:hypothetical protein